MEPQIQRYAFTCIETDAVASTECIRACEQRAKSLETSIRRMPKIQGGCSALRWENRASLGLGEYRLSMLERKQKRRLQRHGTITGNDEDVLRRLIVARGM